MITTQNTTINNLRKLVDGYAKQREMIQTRLKVAKATLVEARTTQTDLDAVQNTVQYVATRVQSQLGDYVGGVVTKAWHHVFRDMKRDFFMVRFRENRGKTETQLRIRTEKGAEAHPFHGYGGGVWDTLSFGMRPCMLLLERPKPSLFLVLDEPFKNLHGRAMRKRAVTMLYNTCKTNNIQAIIVHQSDTTNDTDDSLDVLVGKPDCKVYEVRLRGYEDSEVIPYM